MKRLIPFLILCFTLTGCVNFIEEIFINKDGSGKYQLTIDLSAIYQLQEMLGEESTKEMNLPNEKFDSVFYFKDFPDSVKSKFSNPEILNKLVFNMHGDSKKKDLKMIATFDFKTLDELNSLNSAFQTINDSSKNEFDGLLNQQTKFILTHKKFERITIGELAPKEKTSEEKLTYALLSTSLYTTIYHFPSKVRKSSLKKANIKGNTLTVENKLLDLLSGTEKLDAIIELK